jgi:signal transduction histidine kinase
MHLESLYELFSRGARSQFDARRGLDAARAQALAAAPGDVESPEARSAFVATFLAEALSRLWLERDWRRETLDALLEEAAERMSTDVVPLRLNVAMHVLRDPTLLQLPPALAIEAQVRRLIAFAPFDAVSMWAMDEQATLRCVAAAGNRERTESEAAAAACVLEADGVRPDRTPAPQREDEILVTPIIRWQQPCAALVVRPAAGQARRCRAMMEYGRSILGPILEREALLRRGAATERTLVASSERSLERLGLDLHDRPIQDAAVLAEDVRLFKRQLSGAIAGHEHAAILAGRVDDLEARLVALHGELRQLSHSLAAPTVLRRPLGELLEAEGRAFRDRTEIELDLHVGGDVDAVPNAQRVTLIRIVQEALSNAREHSGARRVRVSVVAHHDRVEAAISDDGRGFAVEQTLTSAAERGRLGLVGINERARVVGGTCDIRSRLDGGTAIAVTLPRVEAASGALQAADGS